MCRYNSDCLLRFHIIPEDCIFANTVKQGASHHDDGKIAYQYVLAMPGLEEVAKVGMVGAQEYGQWNYKAGGSYMRFLGSCSRHLIDFIMGFDKDKKSGLNPLAHLIFDCLMIMDWQLRKVGTDDRFKNNIQDSSSNVPTA